MKTIKIVSKITSRNLFVDEKEVEKINNLYWKVFSEKLIKMETPTFYVKEIGTFTVSKFKNNRLILSLISRYRNIDKLPYKDETKEKLRKEVLIKLRKCLAFRNYLAKEEYNEFISRDKNIST